MVAAIPFAYWQQAAGGGGGGGAPTISEVKSNIDQSGGSGDSLFISFNTAVSAGQYIILAAMSGTTGFNNMNTPSGFTKLYGDNQAYGIYAKKAVGTEGTGFSVTDVFAAGILVGLKITGVGSTPLDVSGQVTNTNTGGSVTTTAANDLVISIYMGQAIPSGGSPSMTSWPSGWTQIVTPDTLRVTSAHDGPLLMGLASLVVASAGASGTAVWVPSGSNASWITTIAVKPT